MAAPLDTFIQLPADESNSGKKIRAESKVINAQTVLEHFMVPVHALTITGNYWCCPDAIAVVASAQNATATGNLWLVNPVGSTITALIREILVDVGATAATVMPTSPVLNFSKFTFTGTPSGGTSTVLPYSTGTTAAQCSVRTAVTGMTVSLVGEVAHYIVPAILTAVGIYGGVKRALVESPQAFVRGQFLELAPGEGIVCYQSTNGTTADIRIFGTTFRWMEVDLS